MSPTKRFLVLGAALMCLFYGATHTTVFRKTIFPGFLRANAAICGGILRSLGHDVVVETTSIHSGSVHLDIQRGCDTIDPSVIFVAGVLAFRAPRRSKLPVIVVGLSLLFALNVVRIVSLFYVELNAPDAFDIVHHGVWQPLFIFLGIAFWAIWAWWATRSPEAK